MQNIVLDSDSKSIVASLASAPVTTNPSFVAAYADCTPNSFTPGANDGVLNGTTPVAVVPAPVAAERVITSIAIQNTDTAVIKLTIAYQSSGGTRTIWSGSLNPGDTWTMDNVMDVNGCIKKAGPVGVVYSDSDPSQKMSVAPGMLWYQPLT